MIVLGIETSCDETAAAVVADGKQILSSAVSSQIEVHHPYGGVVPELASRKHMEAIVPMVDQALGSSGIDSKTLGAVAVTCGPGLVGALLVGFCFAKAFAYALDVPWVGVNHLEAHVNSVFLEPDPPPFPFVALLVSGCRVPNMFRLEAGVSTDISIRTGILGSKDLIYTRSSRSPRA